ncbi:MAG: hypothetical protein ACI9VR_000421 [Cognaticolwellia sp.]|jgi:hypothetical protein
MTLTLLTLFGCAQDPFIVEVVNSSGAPLTLEWETPESSDDGGIADDEEPGQNYGPIVGGVPSSVSRSPIDAGFAWVARTEDGQAKGVILGEEHWPGMTINLDLAVSR